jgi:geranylgeranyl pyrophosphate synthase
MIHTASLVHDDVLDDCSTRRGDDDDDVAAEWEQQISAANSLFQMCYDVASLPVRQTVRQTDRREVPT